MSQLDQDWKQIKACFVQGVNLPEDWRTCGSATNRAQLIRLAAKQMRPKADTKRLESQIDFVCFGN